jgi:hypothetical protein
VFPIIQSICRRKSRCRGIGTHFKNRHALVLWGTPTFSKSKRLPSVEGLAHRAERPESHPPDTDSRLLTVEAAVSEPRNLLVRRPRACNDVFQ